VLAACGATRQGTGWLAHDITSALDRHPGWTVKSVSCPQQVKLAKGVVIHCSATLRNGRVVKLRATQLDAQEDTHLVANEIFADNVERGIMASLPSGASGASAACPNYVPVVVGAAFTCRLHQGARYSRAQVTIVDGDGGFPAALLLRQARAGGERPKRPRLRGPRDVCRRSSGQRPTLLG
jgi:hypothetical protein